MPNYRVSYAFLKSTDDGLPGFSLNVESGLTGNPLFAALPVPVADITDARLDFVAKVDAQHNGGPLATVQKNDARVVLTDMLRQDASYVQTVAGKNLAGLLSSGYNAVSTNRASSPLPKAEIASLLNDDSGLLLLNMVPMVNVRSWEVQFKNGTGAYALFGAFGYARRIIIPSLTPGQSYTVQARGVGGSTGYGSWSDAVTRIVT